MHILEPISASDNVVIVSMISDPTPNELTYVNHIDKNGEQNIYRANVGVRTWLTKDLEVLDNKIYVDNVTKLLDLVKTTVNTVTVNNSVACYVSYQVETIKDITIYNVSTLENISVDNITLSIKDSKAIIYIKEGAVEGDTLEVSLRLGNTINIDSMSYSVKWQSNSQPSGTANGTDVVSYTIAKASGT